MHVRNDRTASVVNLLTYLVADDGVMLMVWRGFSDKDWSLMENLYVIGFAET